MCVLTRDVRHFYILLLVVTLVEYRVCPFLPKKTKQQDKIDFLLQRYFIPLLSFFPQIFAHRVVGVQLSHLYPLKTHSFQKKAILFWACFFLPRTDLSYLDPQWKIGVHWPCRMRPRGKDVERNLEQDNERNGEEGKVGTVGEGRIKFYEMQPLTS